MPAVDRTTPVLLCDPQRRVTEVNGAARDLLGRGSAEVVGRPLADLAAEVARPRAAAAYGLASTLSRWGSTAEWTRLDLVRGDGSAVAVEVQCRARDGRVGGDAVALRAPIAPPVPATTLTAREREVLSLVADGMTGPSIAGSLFLAPATVEHHVAAALRKLGAKNRPHGIALAMRAGALLPGPGHDGRVDGSDAAAALHLQTLDALDDPAAVLGPSGEVLAVNASWRAFARENGRFGVQTEQNYLAVCDAAGPGCADAVRAAAGLRAVLAGHRESAGLEYRCDAPGQPRWMVMRATRYTGEHGPRALVRHRSVTAERLAERRAALGSGLLEDPEIAAIVLTPEAVVSAWGVGAEALFGWERCDAVGRLAWDLVLPRLGRSAGAAITETTTRTGGWKGRLRLQREDGTTFDARLRSRLLRDPDGSPIGISVVAIGASPDRSPISGSSTEQVLRSDGSGWLVAYRRSAGGA